MNNEDALGIVLSALELDSKDGGPLKAFAVPEGIALIGDNAAEVFLLTVKAASFEVRA